MKVINVTYRTSVLVSSWISGLDCVLATGPNGCPGTHLEFFAQLTNAWFPAVLRNVTVVT